MEYFNRYSTDYINTLKSGNGRYKIRLELLSDNETVVGDITKDVSLSAQGQITINYEQITRRSCSLTLIDVDSKYVPHKNSPFWVNRKFKLWVGLVTHKTAFVSGKPKQIEDIYWWSQGVYYTVSATSQSNTLEIEAVDKGAALDGTLKLNMTDYEYVINRNDNLAETIKQILTLDVGLSQKTTMNGLVYSGSKPVDCIQPIIGTRYFNQAVYSQIVIDANNYIGEIFTKLAELYAADCYYDTEGHFMFVPYIESAGYQYTPTQWEFNDLSAFFEEANYNYTYEGENTVMYYTNTTEAGVPNVSWTAYNTNPLSPLNIATGIRRAQSQEIPYYNYYGNAEVEEREADVAEIQKEIKDKGIDINVKVYGNIDMDNRIPIEWTQENIDLYYDVLVSWGENPEEWLGTVSTVYGGSDEFDGVEIAYSPILQATDNAVFLASDVVYEYIDSLIGTLGEGWTTEQLIAADETGLTIDGVLINKLIADAGENAIKVGESLHYVGKYGALAMAQDAVAEAKKVRNDVNSEQMIADCRSAANHYLLRNSLIGMQLSFSCPIIPHMDVNKTIGINDRTVGIEDGIFVVQSITIPLSAEKMNISATNINWLPNDMTFEGESDIIERS